MLDAFLRPYIDPPLNILGKRLTRVGFSANGLTLLGFLFGLLSLWFIFQSQFHWAVAFIVLNRLMDGLDGAVARQTALTDLGGFFDIVADFIIYAGVVFAIGIENQIYAPYTSFLLFSFIGPITTFLAYAIMAAKHQITTTRQGRKSFFYLHGLCEGAETTLVLILLCLCNSYTPQICLIFGIMCWITTLGRIWTTAFTFPQAINSREERKDTQPHQR